MIFIDSHAHLDDKRYEGDREKILVRARENDVGIIVAVCCIKEHGDADITYALLEREGIYGVFGVHPHDARFYDNDLEKYIRELLRHPKAIGIGEIGLDYYYNFSEKDCQVSAFARQIALAKSINKPVIIHSRNAQEETMEILRRETWDFSARRIKGVMHCFSGDYEMAQESIRLGFLISFAGVITFEKAALPVEIVRRLPIENLLSETDCPYLSPAPYRGKRNEPAWVVKVVNKIAEVKNLTVKEVAAAIHSNFSKLLSEN